MVSKRPTGTIKGAKITKIKMTKAIEGTGGIKTRIAERLGVQWASVNDALKREGWDDIREIYQDECEKVGDLAEERIVDIIKDKNVLVAAESTKNARWYLSKKHKNRGYGEESTVTVQGGDKPITVNHNLINISELDLPLETKKEILAAIEKKEAKEKKGRS